MSSLEAWVVIFGFAMLWGVDNIRRTLKECLTVLKQNNEKMRSDLLAIQNEIRMK